MSGARETVAAAPTERAERIEALDVVRGFALLGILLMNIVGMGLPFAAYVNPAYSGPPSGNDFVTWFITNTFFEGAMRTLFSMLFGAGFVILLDRLEAKGFGLMGAKIFLRRTLLLILLGVLNAVVLVWSGDILFGYGFAALFLLVFYRSKLRGLIVWSALLFVALSAFGYGGGAKFQELRQGVRYGDRGAGRGENADRRAAGGDPLVAGAA